MRPPAVVTISILFFASFASAQTPQSKTGLVQAKPWVEAVDRLPPADTDSVTMPPPSVRQLEFKSIDRVVGITATQMAVIPTQCTSNGSLVLQMLRPFNPPKSGEWIEHLIYAVKDNKNQRFSEDSISDLRNVQIIDMFPSSSEFDLLVRARRNQSSSDHPEFGYYLAKFGLDGAYKESIPLPMAYSLDRVAIFPSGNAIISGYDEINQIPRLALVGPKGDLIRNLDLVPMIGASEGQGNEYGSVESFITMGKLVGSVFFTAYRDSILAWRSGGNYPVFEIGDGGGIREVTLQVSPKFVLADMLPSTSGWVAHLRPASWNDEVAHHLDQYSYYEVNPGDGSLIRKLMVSSGGTGIIACEFEGSYLSYEIEDDGKLTILKAN